MNDALPPLPEYEPRSDLWERIQADLTRQEPQSDESLSRIVSELPTYEPKQALWDAIQTELDTVTGRPIWKKPQWLWAGLAAAAVLVLVGSWLGLHPTATVQVRIEYAIEQPAKPMPTGRTANRSVVDKGAEAFIARQCAQQRLACQRPEVHELRNQLVELTTQQQRLERQRHVFGDDPALMRARLKLGHQRAEVLKELITILRS